MKKNTCNSFGSFVSNARLKNCLKHKSSKFSILTIYINNVFFIYISFASILIFFMNNNPFTSTTFLIHINSTKNELIKNYGNLNKKNLKKFGSLLPCKQSLLQPVYIKYVDFWADFQYKDFYLQKLFENKYQINVADNVQDSNFSSNLIYSKFGSDHYNNKYRRCIKIYVTGENNVPDFNEADYSIAFSYIKLSDSPFIYYEI